RRKLLFPVLWICGLCAFVPALVPAYWVHVDVKNPGELPLPFVAVCVPHSPPLWADLLGHDGGYWHLLIEPPERWIAPTKNTHPRASVLYSLPDSESSRIAFSQDVSHVAAEQHRGIC